MKAEGRIFLGFVCFMAIATVAYWTLSHEVAGTTALAFTTFMTFLVGYYLIFTARRIDPRPEDDSNAEISDGAGDLGVFAPHSWMPLAVAGSASIMTLGTIFGWWLAIAGFFFLILSVMGFVFEFYRGDHAH